MAFATVRVVALLMISQLKRVILSVYLPASNKTARSSTASMRSSSSLASSVGAVGRPSLIIDVPLCSSILNWKSSAGTNSPLAFKSFL